jgi:hypothetical protein
MTSIEPFAGNTNYKKIFQVRSEVTRCDLQEVVELWKNDLESYYVLFRYQCTNNTMPIRITFKFTDCIGIETIDDNNQVTLYLTLAYKDIVNAFEKINIGCGSKNYIVQLEKQIYQSLF